MYQSQWKALPTTRKWNGEHHYCFSKMFKIYSLALGSLKGERKPERVFRNLSWTHHLLPSGWFSQGFAPPPKNGVEQKRPGRPLNITSLVRLSSAVPNQISVTWAPEIGKVYRMLSNGWGPVVAACFFFFFFKFVCARGLILVSSWMNHVLCLLQTYSMSVYLVRQLTSPLLLQRLKMKGIRNPDHSRALSNTSNFVHYCTLH